MKDIINLKTMKPFRAEGRVCLELTDPDTGKVKERVEGKNHIFDQSFFCGQYSNYYWSAAASKAYLVLTDSTDAIDTNIPYVMGRVVGYGIPSNNGLGIYRGAYNASNQVLASRNIDSIKWKFQYDFTTAQANGTIGTIGLSHQYSIITMAHFMDFSPPTTSYAYMSCISDSRYSYYCTTAGVITKFDNYLGTSITIDVSAIVGTTSSSGKTVGYAPATGYYYIYVYNETNSLRYIYVFTDSSFSTLSQTYSASNITVNAPNCPLYIYGDFAFWTNGNTIYIANYVTNTMYTSVIGTCSPIASNEVGSNGLTCDYLSGTMAYDKYIICSGNNSSYRTSAGCIFDMSTRSICGYLQSAGNRCGLVRYPFITGLLPSAASSPMLNNCAIAAKKLDTEITKTSNNGLTATYELEVFWEAA